MAAACFSESTGLYAIDVGCDHAKLAIYLVQSGLCRHVLAADVVPGPLAAARENLLNRTLRGESLTHYIDLRLNDGLCGLEDEKADVVFLLGMGGELIASILERAAAFRAAHPNTVYVLQAMTSEPALRRYLAENGFAVTNERAVTDKGRVYAVMTCFEDGVRRSFLPYVYEVGSFAAAHPDKAYLPYIERKLAIYDALVKKRGDAGLADAENQAIRRALLELKQTLTDGDKEDTDADRQRN